MWSYIRVFFRGIKPIPIIANAISRQFIFCFIFILGLFCGTIDTNAANGLPGYTKYGYGARLNVNNPDLEAAIQTAKNVDLDRLVVDFDWSERWSTPDSHPGIDVIRQIIALENS